MMRRHHRRFRVARFRIALGGVVAGAALALTGCAGALVGAPAAVTVTDTVWQPPVTGHPAPSASPASSADGRGDAAAAGSEQQAAAPGSAVTTIIVGRPTVPDPESAGSITARAGDGDGAAPTSTSPATRTARPSAGHTATTSKGATGKPPGSLSTDGNLIAAATSAAAAAGVSPADPDAPGPETGPPCSADPNYVNEAPTGLRSDVITAWRAAVSAAARQGVTLCLNDGKRSRAQQQAQFDQYVEEYGREVAEELVLPPDKSAHVIGIAVDVQPATGYRWLQATKGSLGFCRIYDNEAWHFEYNPAYRRTGCPARLPEPER